MDIQVLKNDNEEIFICYVTIDKIYNWDIIVVNEMFVYNIVVGIKKHNEDCEVHNLPKNVDIKMIMLC